MSWDHNHNHNHLVLVPASANAYVYWLTGDGSVGRAELDGTGVSLH